MSCTQLTTIFELNSADVAFRPEPYPVDRQLGEGTNSLREHSY